MEKTCRYLALVPPNISIVRQKYVVIKLDNLFSVDIFLTRIQFLCHT